MVSIPSKLTGIFPTACVASTCSRQSGACLTISAISASGCTVPNSLSTAHTATMTVSFRISSRKCSKSTLPSRSMSTKSISYPRSCKAVKVPLTEECSSAVEMMCFPTWRLARAMPLRARLFASLAPEVKISSSGCTPNSCAVCAKISSMRACAARPAAWVELALPI